MVGALVGRVSFA